MDCEWYAIRWKSINIKPGVGIGLWGKSGNTLKNCVVTGFDMGILLDKSDNNTLLTNNIVSNDRYGILVMALSVACIKKKR